MRRTVPCSVPHLQQTRGPRDSVRFRRRARCTVRFLARLQTLEYVLIFDRFRSPSNSSRPSLVEVTALDKFVFELSQNPGESTALRYPECPRCKQKILRCLRYMPMINQVHKSVEQVKHKILGNLSEKDVAERRQALAREYDEIEPKLDYVDRNAMQKFFSILLEPKIFVSNGMLLLMKNVLSFLVEIDKLFVHGRSKLKSETFQDLVSRVRGFRRWFTVYLFTLGSQASRSYD